MKYTSQVCSSQEQDCISVCPNQFQEDSVAQNRLDWSLAAVEPAQVHVQHVQHPSRSSKESAVYSGDIFSSCSTTQCTAADVDPHAHMYTEHDQYTSTAQRPRKAKVPKKLKTAKFT